MPKSFLKISSKQGEGFIRISVGSIGHVICLPIDLFNLSSPFYSYPNQEIMVFVLMVLKLEASGLIFLLAKN